MDTQVILESPSLRTELCSEENCTVLEKVGQLKTGSYAILVKGLDKAAKTKGVEVFFDSLQTQMN